MDDWTWSRDERTEHEIKILANCEGRGKNKGGRRKEKLACVQVGQRRGWIISGRSRIRHSAHQVESLLT